MDICAFVALFLLCILLVLLIVLVVEFIRPKSNSRLQHTPNMLDKTKDMSYIATKQSSQRKRREKYPDTFSGDESELFPDLQAWLNHFDIISRHNGWSDAEKGLNIACSLRGKARETLDTLAHEEWENYVCVVGALKKRFDPEHRQGVKKNDFWNRRKRKEETMIEYGYDIKRLSKRAYPKMARSSLEELAIDQFVEGLHDREIQKHVYLKHPQSLDQAIGLATEYESFDIRFPVKMKTKEKPKETQGPDSSMNFKKSLICFSCKKEGHPEKACLNTKKSN